MYRRKIYTHVLSLLSIPLSFPLSLSLTYIPYLSIRKKITFFIRLPKKILRIQKCLPQHLCVCIYVFMGHWMVSHKLTLQESLNCLFLCQKQYYLVIVYNGDAILAVKTVLKLFLLDTRHVRIPRFYSFWTCMENHPSIHLSIHSLSSWWMQVHD
jgi:hypothetical protein